MDLASAEMKKSNPTPFRAKRSQFIRYDRTRVLILILAALFLVLYVMQGSSSRKNSYYEPAPAGTPSVVIVTVTDPETHASAYLDRIRENREQYAALHGYEMFIAQADNYDTAGTPRSWAKLMAIRHVISKHPDCGYVWFLDEKALILNPKTSLEEHLLEMPKLAETILPPRPIVPESIIETFGHLQPKDAALLISQDKSGLAVDSMIVKNSEWAKFLLEQWLEPLYRSYNFEKAERHALEHMVQWHPTILAKIGLVPQRILAPYVSGENGEAVQNGDFLVVFEGCQNQGGPSCAQELERFWPRWNMALGAL
ncbi:galactosyl transferase GMA12/MNN10 family protein [Sarocladium implicatum]|nr:galactosyl transferase GMA12/MNN10 family protein [Sarocladium implicatum]